MAGDDEISQAIKAQEPDSFRYCVSSNFVLGENVDDQEENEQEEEYQASSSDDDTQTNTIHERTDLTPGETFIAVGNKEEKKKKKEIPDIEGDPRSPWRPTNCVPATLVQ